MPKLLPGDRAPDLTLPAADGSSVPLSDLWTRGWTLLTFYRGDSCPVCNRYLHGLQEVLGQFQEAGARIVAISADRPDLERETVERQKLAFPVLSDPEHRAIDAYDVIYNETAGHAEPAVFLISPTGTIAYESIVSGPLGRPAPDDLLKIVHMASRR